ncbi:MAG: LamG domain-containing protein, partial [Proteobacteria bacterium]|nr:LamG domain-containing protein [Pseudomonadota bacterium]
MAQDADQASLLFHASADRDLAAEVAQGAAAPLFSDRVKIVPTGVSGGAIEAAHDQILAWSAPGNIYAQRGTLAFYWRAREPVGSTPFPIFRVGYADHSSWDMTWLRLDWNGRGFDGFVTDTNLARTRVSHRLAAPPRPDEWVHLAFAWDEAAGVRLFVNGREAGRQDRGAVYDAGLYAFGPHSRIISPYQVQSRYSFMRGGDVDEIRIYDRMLTPEAVAALARNAGAAPPATEPVRSELLAAFQRREGWAAGSPPPYLEAPATRVRKVEFTDARDVKQWNWKGNDGIRETTWPGVYNRSRIAGRNDYFQLPDWNVNSLGGKTVTYSLPDEPWNRLEIVGAAHGALEYVPASGPAARLGARPQGRERTWHSVPERRGGAVRFNNVVQETPIQEIAAYQVGAGAPPKGVAELTYTVRAQAAPDMPALAELNTFVRGRRPAGERATVVALPSGAPSSPRTGRAEAGSLPFVNLMIPASFRDTVPGGPIRRFEYGWEGLDAGLDWIAIDIPALKIKPTHGGLVPLNVRIKDPLWPGRDLLDISVSVRPGEARTLWLDTRDRLLPEGRSLYLTVASAAPEFGTDDLDGMNLRLVFKPRAAALAEHENDRFQQVRDNMAFVVEEHPRDKRLALFDRLQGDLSDLLRANPEHVQGRAYWAEINAHQPAPAFAQPTPPAGVPLWAFRQVEDLKRVRQFVNWWIDERQAKNGEFGGGLSDDTDLLQQWPPLALMGVDPDKVKSSLNAMVEAVYANGMFTNGLSTIKTDELHAYEEGINGISEAMYLAYGEPKAVERLMATARAYPRIIQPNAAGHTHFVSNYFSGTDVSRESVWEWSKPYSYLVIHPAILLADFNGDPTMRKLITGLADGWLAHGDRQADGSLLLPAEINWRTDAERDQLATTPGGVTVLQLFWAAYRLSGDPKYLKPIEDWAARDISGLSTITADAVDLLGRRDSWGRTLTESAARPDANNSARYQAWRNTGDKSHLAALYGEELKT